MSNILTINSEDNNDSGLPYRITVKAARPEWHQKTACILPISLGHNYHEGEKLESLFYWANKRFDTLIINLGDTLHRHNLMRSGYSAEDAFRQSLQLGEEWLVRNTPLMERQINKPCIMTRWSDWIFNPEYNDLEAAMRQHYEESENFRQALHSDINRFNNRQETDAATKISDNIVCAKSVDYLLEEATVNILIARQYQPIRAYPADDMNCFQYLSTAELPDAIRGLEKSIRVNVKFKRKSSFQALEGLQAA